MNLNHYAKMSINELLATLKTTQETGLSNDQVITLQEQYGLNVLPRHGQSWRHILMRQFSSSFTYLLVIASILSFALSNYGNGIMILLIVLIASILGFYQEFYAEKTVQLLMHYLTPQCKVKRNGIFSTINSNQLVPGDIIELTYGDTIPADVRFLVTQGVSIDESTLSGESAPANKNCTDDHQSSELFFVASSIGLCGSKIVSGHGLAVVIATGNNTMISSIAQLGSDIDRPSMFATEIGRLSNIIAVIVIFTLIAIFVAHLLISNRTLTAGEISLFMIALAVSLIPQSMPAVMTFALSQGARDMARKSVIVKRLAAIEDLGSITVLCTDKTGTITENKLAVSDVFSDDQQKTIYYALLAHESDITASTNIINPFDQALKEYADDYTRSAIDAVKLSSKIPYNAQERCNGVIINNTTVIIRGAYEHVLGKCTLSNNAQTHTWASHEGKQGNRVFAIAIKEISSYTPTHNYLDDTDFAFIGMVSFVDRIKPSVYPALKEAQLLGVKIKIITGDAPEVAAHVAQTIGLITSNDAVMTGNEFMQLSEDEQQQASLRIAVFARTLPEQKFHILSALKKTERVGFLGEGINDVPSLKNSHVGIVVENSANIAKDAADIILLEKNLLVIIDGIQEGRKIFTNTLTYFQGMLTSNFSRFYTVAFASFFIDHLPMLPLQILLTNFLSDLPLIFIATDNVELHELEKPRHYKAKELLSFGMILGGICLAVDFFFFKHFLHTSPETLQTTWFMFTVVTELIFFYLIRTKQLFFTAARPTMPLIVLAILSACITFALPYTNIGKTLFNFTPPTAEHIMWVIGFLGIFFIVMECSKLAYYKIFTTEHR